MNSAQAWPVDLRFLRDWQNTVYEGGWAGISWPKKYGGRGASLLKRMIFDQEMAAHSVPGLMNVLGLESVCTNWWWISRGVYAQISDEENKDYWQYGFIRIKSQHH